MDVTPSYIPPNRFRTDSYSTDQFPVPVAPDEYYEPQPFSLYEAVLLTCFPEVHRSIAGFVGLSAAVSCMTSGLWFTVCPLVYWVWPTNLPVDPTNDGIGPATWMVIGGLVSYYQHGSSAPQVNHARFNYFLFSFNV